MTKKNGKNGSAAAVHLVDAPTERPSLDAKPPSKPTEDPLLIEIRALKLRLERAEGERNELAREVLDLHTRINMLHKDSKTVTAAAYGILQSAEAQKPSRAEA